ncbi:MAG: ACS family MFS transporter [Gemmatimonadetes bacterium]|nr:ACS family MFS transporter [Gemmatimonadota bacterium]MCC6770629.1 ACS family MFS transporter [Gemmatimonadaceae bacterium]
MTTTRRWPAHYTVVLLCFAAVFISYIDRTNISVASIAMQEEFSWTETTKGIVLSSFFVGYILLQVVSGTLANRYGGKLVLGVAVVWWSLFTVLTPPAALLSLPALIAARIALGLGEAAVFPASINMVGRWVPTAQRSRAVALFSSGLSIGTVFSLPVTGWLVRDYGWPVPFYAFGLAGLVWAAFWITKVPRGRGVEEEQSVGGRTIPWKRLLSNTAVWAIIINHFCNNWALYVLLAWLPSYFKTTFDVTLANAGLLSAAPWLLSFVMANVAGSLADRMLRRGQSATVVRKTMQGIGLLGGASFLLLMPLATTATTGVLLMCGAAGSLAFCLAGFGPNCFDIAPRYADVIWGISNTFGTIPGIIGVAVTGWLVERTGGYTAPFVVTAVIAVTGAVIFLRFGSGERQID